MATSQTITLNGAPVVRMELHVPNQGPWWADCKLNAQVALTGKVSIKWGDNLTLLGTIDPGNSGGFVVQSTYRVVGGGDGWGTLLSPKGSHNDAQVSTSKIASEVAKEVGETIGNFEPKTAKFTTDYIRPACFASRVIEDCAGGNPWWVSFDGLTNVGPRPTSTPSQDQYHLIDFDPSNRELTLGLESAPCDGDGTIVIGSVITDDRLDGPQTVRELFIVSEGNTLTCKAWCESDSSVTYSRLAKTFRNLVAKSTDDKLWGKWRYRVLSMASDGRVSLQVVNKDAGLPDAILVKQAPGVAGTHSELTPGCIVLVEFLEGDRTLPVITGASEWDPNGQQSPNYVPKRLTLGSVNEGDGQDAARKGDSIEGLLPPATFVGTIVISGVPSPATGAIIWSAPKVLGVVTKGSTKVGVAT